MDTLFFVVAFLSSIVGAICGIGGVVIKPVLDMLRSLWRSIFTKKCKTLPII